MKRYLAGIMAFMLLVAMLPTASTAEAAPSVLYEGSGELVVKKLGEFTTGVAWAEGGAEIITYDKASMRAFVVNGGIKSVEILDLSKLTSTTDINQLPSLGAIKLEELGFTAISDITSVAVSPKGGIIALSLPADPATQDGKVAILDIDGKLLSSVHVGVLPDMITFTPDGKYILTANEGQPSDDYTIDPEGTVSIIDISAGPANVAQDHVTTVRFDENVQIDQDVRIAKPGATYAEDFEPEYMAITPDSKIAYVVLQENNAIATLDIATKSFTSVKSLGYKDHSLLGNGFDASNKDDMVNIRRWPVLGSYQPDGLDLFTSGGTTYLLTANEGDAKDYDGYSEEIRVKDIVDSIHLDAAHYKGYTQAQLDEAVMNGLFADEQLGRLKLTSQLGMNEDGRYTSLHSYGARSFSIWDVSDMSLVYDSGDHIERTVAQAMPEYFNTNSEEVEKDSRSDDKGPEPEDVKYGTVGDQNYAFVGLERAGGIMAYNITNPEEPVFSTYFNSREFVEEGKDSGPEGLRFIPAADSPTGNALLLVAYEISGTVAVFELTPAPATTKITLLHTNDTHARVEEGSAEIGFAKISTLVQQHKANNPNTLLLDAGDTFHGTTFATLVQGESIAEVMNNVGYDAMTAGNHDFNYGYERLLEIEEMLTFPLVSANVKNADGTRLFKPYIIEEVDGVRLGIFGLATPETTYKTHPKNVEGLIFTDPAEEAKSMVAELEGKVDAIIAVTHLGIDESSTDTSVRVAKAAPGIDIIVDGHSHSTLVEGMQSGEDTLIVSAGEYTKNLGVVELVFDADKKLITKQARLTTKEETALVEADPAILKVIQMVKDSQETVLAEIVGETAVKLEGEREFVRVGETNLGNLITDAMLDISGADIAMTNGGGIRASINPGKITKNDIITVLPFGNYIVTKRVSGADIKAALEQGTDAFPATKGAFPHVAGMTYVIDTNKPVGDRIESIMIQGKAIDMETMYLLATNDFMAAGGDEYTMLEDDAVVNEFPALDEALIAYIQQLGTVDTEAEGRIKIEGMNNEQPAPTSPDLPTPTPVPTPAPAPIPSPTPAGDMVYIVQKGDNLWAIGRKYKTTWQELAKLNNLSDPALIFPGQKIVIRK